MMYDRPYMTTSFDERAKRILLWIIGINVGVFVLQNILSVSGAGGVLSHYFALRADSLQRGLIWTPFTYSFLHSTTSFLHILGNMLMVFFIGRALIPVLGQKRFLQLYIGAAVMGGLVWLAVSFLSGAHSVVGASGAALGLLAVFACLYPDREIQLLLFFVLPVRIKPKVAAWVVLGISILGMIFWEILGNGSFTAHSAHLGGMFGGWLFYKYIYLKHPYTSNEAINFSVPKIFKKTSAQKKPEAYRYSVNVSQPAELKLEVDRILDKINSKGFGSLSAAEKKVLDEARDLLRKR